MSHPVKPHAFQSLYAARLLAKPPSIALSQTVLKNWRYRRTERKLLSLRTDKFSLLQQKMVVTQRASQIPPARKIKLRGRRIASNSSTFPIAMARRIFSRTISQRAQKLN